MYLKLIKQKLTETYRNKKGHQEKIMLSIGPFSSIFEMSEV